MREYFYNKKCILMNIERQDIKSKEFGMIEKKK
jgi:hypothetical protein